MRNTADVLTESQLRVRELLHALEALRRDREAAASAGDTTPPPAPLADVRGLTDRERAVLALRYTSDGRPRPRSCAATAAALRISGPRVAQLSTHATSKLVAMVRARRAGERLPAHAETDLARFAGLVARWWSWSPPARHLAAIA